MRTLTMKEEKRLEVYTNSLSGRADGGGGDDDDRSQLAARYGRLLPFWPRVQSKDCRSLFKIGSSIFEGIVAQTP